MIFKTINDLLNLCNENNLSISEVALKSTALELEISEEEVYNRMKISFDVMMDAINDGLELKEKSVSGMSGGMAIKMKEQVINKKNFSGSFLGEIIYSALAVSEINACMGKIVAAPTAGSCGILPACLSALKNHLDLEEKKLIMALINASAIGKVISINATVSGAEGGCQAECGSASAMIASGITEALGGTPKMCADAAAQALKSHLGLVCDPVAGLVEEPCIIRNVSSATIAVSSAEMTLAGIESIIPLDEVIETMYRVGCQLPPELRETAKGGVAITDTAKKIEEKVFGKK